ncbi:S1 family serine peptidase [Streptomyces sp. NPDC001339]|uniref:S1 family serine peptidase n=1 Tax=Streptomyces sp. NPDC001339 TaxID=3364563 RepID=UPI003698D8F5
MNAARLRQVALAGAVLTGAAALVVPAAAPAAAVVGGDRADITKYPWTVALTSSDDVKNPQCAGTLIAPNKVLTASHCVKQATVDTVRVVGGREDLRQTGKGTVRKVAKLWIHPKADTEGNGATYAHDIAVLTLNAPMRYRTLPLATPAQQKLYEEGTPSRVLGWGSTTGRENDDRVPPLQTALIPNRGDESCVTAYGSRRYDKRYTMCLGYPAGGVNACEGDSGGPVVAGGRLVGVISGGGSCTDRLYPGVAVKTASYYALLQGRITGETAGKADRETAGQAAGETAGQEGHSR